MFSSDDGIKSMGEAIERVKNAPDARAFEDVVCHLRTYMKNLEMDSRYLIELERKAYYLRNEYSEKDTKERMEEAKNRVAEFLAGIMDNHTDGELLVKVLDNYYLFLENLLEREPHKKGNIQKEQLQCLKIGNEYDVQYLLYAYLKPLYPMARLEVNEDTGYGTVRTDIWLDLDNVIEIKCTRKGMLLKRLIEEIEADMIHYSAKCIYFFIYDKEKIIENAFVFQKTYERKLRDKEIHIIIHQPKIL